MTRTQLVEEAVALERAGGTWAVKHAAAVTGYSPSHIRNSDCPKHTEPGGPRSRKGRGKIVLIPKEVRDWKAALLDRETAPRVRMSA